MTRLHHRYDHNCDEPSQHVHSQLSMSRGRYTARCQTKSSRCLAHKYLVLRILCT